MKKYLSWILLLLIILASFLLMFYSSKGESAIMDELAHIPAGYGYDRYLDYRLNPEHPPLIKALAALPILFQEVNFPTDKASWQSDVNGQWSAGAQFLYESGNDADEIIQWMRLGPMILVLLLILLIYIWAKELMGKNWALLPAFLFGFSPTVLAHGHYVTTDLGAAFGIFAASYFFIKYLFNPSRKHLIFAGIFFGIAQLLKFSAVLLVPFFGFLILVFVIWKAKNGYPKKFWRIFFQKVLSLILIFVIGYILVWIVYGIFTLNYPIEKQKADTEFILTSFAGGPVRHASQGDAGESSPLLSSCIDSPGLRCLAEVNIKMASNRITRPLAEYMLGVLMVIQRSSGGNTAYFLGEVSGGGWWYYFPVVFLLKEPLASLILIALALLIALWNIGKKLKAMFKAFGNYLGTHFAEFSMIVFVIFYWVYSVKSPLNIGVRHILPTIPFIYILSAGVFKKWSEKGLISSILKKALIFGLAFWYLMETLISAPFFISYFNHFGGGTENGYTYVTDSNYDWGQDLKRLASWVENPPAGEKIEKIAVNYFGGGSPEYYMGDKAKNWQSSDGNPLKERIQWFAISINNLQGALGKLTDPNLRNPEDEYSWLKNPYEPYAKAGTSIFIYKLY